MLSTTGGFSVAVGFNALGGATGGQNTAVGDNALFSVTTGVLNTALGDLAGNDIVAGKQGVSQAMNSLNPVVEQLLKAT